MAKIRDYGRVNRTVTFAGKDLGKGIVTITYPSPDQSAVGYSADGEMIAAASGRQGGEVVITTLPGSEADRYLQQLSLKFSTGELEIDINMSDAINGQDTVNSIGGVFMRSSLGIEVAEGVPTNTEYAFEFQSIKRSLTAPVSA